MTNTLRRTAFEYEFIALRSDGSAMNRDDMLGLWRYFINLGWNEKRDAYNNELLGVYKSTQEGNIVLDNDGSACLLEVAWPPYEDIHRAQKEFSSILRLILNYFKDNYRLIGYGCAPFTDPLTLQLTPKSHYPVIESTARGEVFKPFYISGAIQINLDGSFDELLRAENVFLQLTGVFTALSANSSIYQGKITPHKEQRQYHYDVLASHMPQKYQDLFGIPKKPFSSWQHYFRYLLGHPARLLLIDSKFYKGKDSKNIIDCLKTQSTLKLEELERTYFSSTQEKERYRDYQRVKNIILKPHDILMAQAFCWFDTRLKFGFKDGVETGFTEALFGSSEEFDIWLKKNLLYAYIEIRPVSMQLPEEQIIFPAFALGIMENLDSAEKVLAEKSWSFWQEMRVNAYKDGMRDSVGNVPIEKYLKEFYDIAFEGLQKRSLDEEKYILPLEKRIQSKITPTETAEKVLKNEGKEKFLDFITITQKSL